MRTVKLVLIGASGVGKTALRGKYITGRFLSGYRATIGADFITKTLPHPTNPEESVTLQIWDTAGQERFSSLSNAFFRGADAAVLMFDVNTPETMEALVKWWDEFCLRAPLAEEDVEDFCCVLVGNKIDIDDDDGARVTELEALQFMKRLVPIAPLTPSDVGSCQDDSHKADSRDKNEDGLLPTMDNRSPLDGPESELGDTIYANGLGQRSNNIDITPFPAKNMRKHEHILSKFRSSHSDVGTATSRSSGISKYYTPVSSLFDEFASALSSPAASNSDLGPPPRLRRSSNDSESSSSGATVTPSLFARENMGTCRTGTTITIPDDGGDISIRVDTSRVEDPDSAPVPFSANTITPDSSRSLAMPSHPPYRGPKLLFTSAQTGEGVSEVFEYIGERVSRVWDYEERLEARRLHMREASAADTIRLRSGQGGEEGGCLAKWTCCSG
ncbi:hypothetical protein AX17_006917 [Amanita inopinata Kibby_2008]|nr:hypothetical protein AX17_006917 [Amanita inopinata Kibby_2008]